MFLTFKAVLMADKYKEIKDFPFNSESLFFGSIYRK